MTDPGPTFRVARESDLDALTELWLRSARPNHTFMDDDEFVAGAPFIRDSLLPSMEVWMAVDADDNPLGFVGARDGHVELLYIDPAWQGRGLGSALMAHVADGGPQSVEVYSGNTAGLAFYRSQGFVETRRHPRDAAGRPFEVSHLDRA